MSVPGLCGNSSGEVILTQIPILNNSKVILRPLSQDDVVLLYKWFFEPDVLKWLQISEDLPEYRTMEAVQERFVQRLNEGNYDEDWLCRLSW